MFYRNKVVELYQIPYIFGLPSLFGIEEFYGFSFILHLNLSVNQKGARCMF